MKDTPATWGVVAVRALIVAVTAFVVLQAKEYYDAGAFDTPANTVDALLVGVGTFLVYAVVKWANPKRVG
ncbi:MAG TPA: hypothetical protein VKD28_08080 [Gemmatimonadales bacterium]|nr:hypothetical protein [Gemmatimonadales bacterium]